MLMIIPNEDDDFSNCDNEGCSRASLSLISMEFLSLVSWKPVSSSFLSSFDLNNLEFEFHCYSCSLLNVGPDLSLLKGESINRYLATATKSMGIVQSYPVHFNLLTKKSPDLCLKENQ